MLFKTRSALAYKFSDQNKANNFKQTKISILYKHSSIEFIETIIDYS